jgi:hypothetical protein
LVGPKARLPSGICGLLFDLVSRVLDQGENDNNVQLVGSVLSVVYCLTLLMCALRVLHLGRAA